MLKLNVFQHRRVRGGQQMQQIMVPLNLFVFWLIIITFYHFKLHFLIQFTLYL